MVRIILVGENTINEENSKVKDVVMRTITLMVLEVFREISELFYSKVELH